MAEFLSSFAWSLCLGAAVSLGCGKTSSDKSPPAAQPSMDAGGQPATGARGGSAGKDAGAGQPSTAGGAGGLEAAEGGAGGNAGGAELEGGAAGEGGTEASPEGTIPAICQQEPPVMPPLLGELSSCPEGCREIVALPLDLERLCVDAAAAQVISCSCGELLYGGSDFEVCLNGDGVRWLVARGRELAVPANSEGDIAADPPATYDAERFSPCSGEEDAELAGYPHCDFVDCAVRVESSCSAGMTLAAEWQFQCSGFYDGFPAYGADGCLKASCVTDEDCAADERCVQEVWSTPQCTLDSAGGCNCGSTSGLDFQPSVCVETDLAGPRGAWQSYTIEDFESGWFWRVTPDGAVTSNSGGALHQATLSPSDLDWVDEQLNGYFVRNGIQNGFSCSTFSPVYDLVNGTITLQIDGVELSRRLPNCFSQFPAGVVLREY